MADITAASLLSNETEEQKLSNKYDEDRAKIFCMYIVDGLTVDDALKKIDLSKDVYYRWRYTHKDFGEMVKVALQERSWSHMEQCLEIADDASDDVTMGNNGPMINGKAIRRAEIMINTRMKIAAKMTPKVFGDKTQMEVTGADGKDLAPATFNIVPIPHGQFLSREEATAEHKRLQEENPSALSDG